MIKLTLNLQFKKFITYVWKIIYKILNKPTCILVQFLSKPELIQKRVLTLILFKLILKQYFTANFVKSPFSKHWALRFEYMENICTIHLLPGYTTKIKYFAIVQPQCLNGIYFIDLKVFWGRPGILSQKFNNLSIQKCNPLPKCVILFKQMKFSSVKQIFIIFLSHVFGSLYMYEKQF